MALFPAPTPSPTHVHDRVWQLTGHRAFWLRRTYSGGIYSTAHFRVCSYCGSIHPGDLIRLLYAGGRLESTAKPDKFLLFTPNPVAGQQVRMGSVPGRVFSKARWPQNLVHQLYSETDGALEFKPSISERLCGHFEHAAFEPAPALIKWPFYSQHTDELQWPDIWAAASNHGERQNEIQGT